MEKETLVVTLVDELFDAAVKATEAAGERDRVRGKAAKLPFEKQAEFQRGRIVGLRKLASLMGLEEEVGHRQREYYGW